LGARSLWRISNSVDTDFFSPASDESGVSEQECVILCPRMLVPKNGVGYALDAMSHLARNQTRAKLLIAGDGPLRQVLEEKAEKIGEGRISFLGECDREQMRSLNQRADIVLVPSITSKGLQEATSISALEAMACGKPIIASNIGGLSEIVVDGETGFLVEERSGKAIADRITKLIRNVPLREEMGTQARNRILERYSRRKWIGEIERVYKTIIWNSAQ
jgi:glycosyltransferase involved in cell wall biosynthesis